jgi:hypothetical protein
MHTKERTPAPSSLPVLPFRSGTLVALLVVNVTLANRSVLLAPSAPIHRMPSAARPSHAHISTAIVIIRSRRGQAASPMTLRQSFVSRHSQLYLDSTALHRLMGHEIVRRCCSTIAANQRLSCTHADPNHFHCVPTTAFVTSTPLPSLTLTRSTSSDLVSPHPHPHGKVQLADPTQAARRSILQTSTEVADIPPATSRGGGLQTETVERTRHSHHVPA